MACKTSYELHHNFPKLAEESGFTFNTRRPRIRLDWNRIRQIDVESLVKDRKFVVIEQHVTDILDCVLESEFDLRILDEGVAKIFRLAQLAVEYQQFCRHYLDRSVYVLREEITSLAQDLERTKKENRDKDEELRKLRKRTRLNMGSLPYGNENIATMILKSLNNRGDLINTASSPEVQHYNKCNYCNKVFLNQLYLKSHVSRRHGNVSETPEKDVKTIVTKNIVSENPKLTDEIMQLKEKLNEMEAKLSKPQENINQNDEKVANCIENYENKNSEPTNNIESLLLEKIEEWKKEEHGKHNKEILLLQGQIAETIASFKQFEKQKSEQTEASTLDRLHATITEQGNQIEDLKKELLDSKNNLSKEDIEIKKEFEAQIAFWIKRADEQTKQYEDLVKNLNEVAKEAQESKNIAQAEKQRAEHLERRLGEVLSKKDNLNSGPQQLIAPEENKNGKRPKEILQKYVKQIKKSDKSSLEKLHQKAQQLLDMNFTTSSDTDEASSEEFPIKSKDSNKNDELFEIKKGKNRMISRKDMKPATKFIQSNESDSGNNSHKNIKSDHIQKDNINRLRKKKKEKSKSNYMKTERELNKTTEHIIPASPLKLVRAKLVEEVHNRLVTAGVDPLKRRMPLHVFQKQRSQLQQLQELKSKKNQLHSKVRNSILTYLDSTTPQSKIKDNEIQEYTSPNNLTKSFSLSSVISNVKTKAMSLVRTNEFQKAKSKSLGSEVAKRALSLLRTPPGSATSSPTKDNISVPVVSQPVEDLSASYKMKSNGRNTIRIKTKEKGKHQTSDTDTDTNSFESDDQKSLGKESTKSIDNLIQSPAKRPSSGNADYVSTNKKKLENKKQIMIQAQSTDEISKNNSPDKFDKQNFQNFFDSPIKKALSDDNILKSPKQTKGVLKNASSTSSLNKKKVLFDMDAIQMKSVSASPSQSITEKGDTNEKYDLGLVNLDDEEWDISSIDNEPLKNDTKIQVNSRASPKIAELKKTIESQLARRNDTPPTAIVGGFDMLRGPVGKTSSTGGSNTSLGSSILDDSEAAPTNNQRAFIKPKNIKEKDDSELDLSEFSIDGIIRNKNDSF